MGKSLSEQLKAISKVMNKPSGVPDYTFNFGKHNGRSLQYVYDNDPKYLHYLYHNSEDGDFPQVLEKFLVKFSGGKS